MNGYRRMFYPIKCLHCGTTKDAVRKTAKYCSTKCQLAFEYATGHRDPKTIALAAHQAIRDNGYPERRGQPIPQWHNAIARAKMAATKTGKQVPNLQGANHWNWKGGVDKGIWHTPEYQAWRKAVMRRDGFKCVFCGYDKGKILEADHIKPRYLYPELTFDVDNGRTLCKPCHRDTETWGTQVKQLKRVA